MPRYDIECPNCGVYERATTITSRADPCDKCGSPVDVLITSSTPSKGFEAYYDDGLGEVITGLGHRRQVMRGCNFDYRDHPSPGEQSARRDRLNDRRKAEAARVREQQS